VADSEKGDFENPQPVGNGLMMLDDEEDEKGEKVYL
jgi:hypothetical protein